MKTIAILGPTGMLGSMVYNVLKERYQLVLVYRDAEKFKTLDAVYGGVSSHRSVDCDLMDLCADYVAGFPTAVRSPALERLVKAIGPVDMVVNCAGVIKPHSTKNPLTTMFTNAALPHLLSAVYGPQLIQITTDCVYNGLEGAPYNEQSIKNANDLYGLSKGLGEPQERSLVLRTSIIGPELGSSGLSFLSWFLEQPDGAQLKGFTNHHWNGLTTKVFAEVCARIIDDRSRYPNTGLFHIFSTDISKYDMLLKCKAKYGREVTIEPTEVPTGIDRRLRTVYDLCSQLAIPSFDEMLAVL